MRGNVVVLPQDTLWLHTMILPGLEETNKAHIVLFISSHTKVSSQTLSQFPPVLMNKAIVCNLTHFLVMYNPWYHSVVTVSEAETEKLYVNNHEVSFPVSVELVTL